VVPARSGPCHRYRRDHILHDITLINSDSGWGAGSSSSKLSVKTDSVLTEFALMGTHAQTASQWRASQKSKHPRPVARTGVPT
jgi:hypothetical protein